METWIQRSLALASGFDRCSGRALSTRGSATVTALPSMPRLKVGVSRLPERECEHNRGIPIDLRTSCVEAGMAGVVIDAQKHGLAATGGCLQACGEFGGHPCGYPLVIKAGIVRAGILGLVCVLNDLACERI